MQKHILNSLTLAIFFAFFISDFIQAQNSLTVEAEPSFLSESEVSFHNLENYDLYEIDGKAIYDFAQKNKFQPFTLRLEIDETRDWEMNLDPAKVHGDDYYALTSSGEKIELEKNITYKGFLKNDPATKVRVTISENLIQGVIFDEEMHAFETTKRDGGRTKNDLTTIYKMSENGLKSGGCGHDAVKMNENLKKQIPNVKPKKLDSFEEFDFSPQIEIPTEPNPPSAMNSGYTYCPKLGVSLDWQGLDFAGSVAQFNSDLQATLNIVNGYHDNEFSVEFELTPIFVVSSAPNPWPDDPCCNGEQNLYNYRDWAKDNFPHPFTCTLLFTGQNFGGISWGMLDVMCTPTAAGQIAYADISVAHRGNITTHEIGHIWGCNHGAQSPDYIMSPSIWTGTLQWTSTSTNVINNKISAISGCLPSCAPPQPGWIPSTVTRGTYLNSGTPNSVVLKWRTSNSIDSKVWYGTSLGVYTDSVTVSGNVTDHEVEVSGLSPNTTYYYAVGASGGKMEGEDSEHYFTTAPTTGSSQPITAWILGDCGTNNSNQAAVRDAYYNYIGSNHTDMILLLGDNAYDDGWDAEYQGAIFEMYESKLKNSVVWSCPGNHDYYGQGGLNADYYDIFTFPTQAEAGGLASNTEKYYSFDYGNIHIVSLDSHDEDRSTGSPMLTWLENDLAATTQDWIVVIFHHPPYTKGSHDSDTESRLIEMRQNAIPICEDYGVDLVLSGHSHSYERSKLINGHYGSSGTYNPSIHDIDGGDGRLNGDGAYQQNSTEEGTVYIVTGSAGKTSGMVGTHPIMYYSDNPLGSTILEVNGDQLDIKFLRENGNIDDYLTLTQNGTPSVNWTNPYNNQIFTDLNSIAFAATASDNDGNVTQVEFFVDGVSVGVDYTAPYTNLWTPPTYANYVLTATATDNDGKTNSNQINITVQNGASINISVQVSASADDAEERVSDGDMDLTSSDLELAQESGVTSQEVGMRFNNVNIPQGSTITNAYVQFTNDESESSAMNLSIFGEDIDNSPGFSTVAYNISNRTKTSATVNWSPVPWTVIGAAGTDQQTPDLSSIIQEIVSRPGWSVNNSMSIIITGTEDRTAESYDGMPSGAPTLHVTYTVGGGNNCAPYTDNDNDGHCSDVDCDDNNAAVFPGATEVCDGIDNDCDGLIDENGLNTFYEDSDGDGFGDPNSSVQDCFAPSGYVANDLDCDDSDGNVHPNASEVCDGIDNDCDGQIDENLIQTYYADTDGDGFGDPNISMTTCNPPANYVLDNTDCDDSDENIHPNATEICDGLDNNCNGQIDEGTCIYCTPIHTGSQNELITNVTVGSINNSTGGWNTSTPGYSDYINISTEVDIGTNYTITVTPNYSWADSKMGIWADWNQNQTFESNEEIASLSGSGPWTANFTPPSNATLGTTRLRIRLQYGASYTPDPCAYSNYYSGETEDYSLEVVNCTTNTYYADTDGDGYGDPNNSTVACSQPSGYVSDNTDCDDSDGNIYPTAPCDDGNPLTDNDEYDSNCICVGTSNSGTSVISSTVNSSSDDAEEDISDGSMSLTSSDLELVDEHGNDPQEVGIRFNNITVPNGATIVNAYIQFTVDETDSGTTNLDIYGEAHDNAPTFTSSLYNISTRTKTAASVNWNPPAWNTSGEAWTDQQTPNLSAVIQEIVNRGGWNSGNSLAIIVTGSGERTAESYDGSAAPQLFIEYSDNCTTENDHDFEPNWGIWNDGGSDARRSINDAAYANSGSYCVRLRDNTSTSVMTTDNLDLSGYSEITVGFSYQVESFENTEDFWLQISTDGGATFNTEEDWVRTIDFQNGERHNPLVTINGPFSTTTQIRFRCDASGNSDWVYIDDVVIKGCGTGGSNIIIDDGEGEIFEEIETVESEFESEIEISEINVFPNPVSTELTIEYRTFEAGQTYIGLYDLRGQKVLSQPIEVSEGLNVFQLNIGKISEGMYLLNIMESKARLTKQIVISR